MPYRCFGYDLTYPNALHAAWWGSPGRRRAMRPPRGADESALTHAIVELASLYGRYGYRTILACCRATREECNDANLNALPQAF